MTRLGQASAGLGLFLLGAASALGLRAWLSPSPAAVTTIQREGDWRLVCTPEAAVRCSLQQDIAAAAGGAPVVRLTVTGAKAPELIVVVPHGVLLPPGLGIVAGKAPMRIRPYQACDSTGCIVRAPFDEAMAKDFAAAQDAQIVLAGRDGKPVGVRFSLKGFSMGLSDMRHAEASRLYWWKRILGA